MKFINAKGTKALILQGKKLSIQFLYGSLVIENIKDKWWPKLYGILIFWRLYEYKEDNVTVTGSKRFPFVISIKSKPHRIYNISKGEWFIPENTG